MMGVEAFPAAAAWLAPVIDGSVAAGGTRRSPLNPREEQRLRADAEAAGRAAGLASAQKEIDARRRELDVHAAALRTALEALSRPLAHLDDVVHEQVALLATHLARSLVRRELRADPSQVIAIVRETVALLPASTRGVRVMLHPEDAALVRERVQVAGPESAWTLVDDPALARGDCRVYTDYAQIDARMETRLKEALAALVGDERRTSREEGAA
jgi:flagellar assembly protein FliH